MTLPTAPERILLVLSPVSIHGAEYVDILLADPAAPEDPGRALRARLGAEAIEGDPRPGDRVRVSGFLGTVLGIERVG